MGAWETVLAACGGMVLGLGIGMMIGSGATARAQRRARRDRSRVRASVIPVLEGQALALGLDRQQRGSSSEDPFDTAVELSMSIQRYQETHNMAFSDTLQLSRNEFEEGDR